MYGPNEEMLKKMASDQECCGNSAGAATIGGSLGYGLDEPCRPSLMERVSSQRRRAQAEARQGERLAELSPGEKPGSRAYPRPPGVSERITL